MAMLSSEHSPFDKSFLKNRNILAYTCIGRGTVISAFHFHWIVYVGIYKKYILHLALKYVRIFVRGHYLFREPTVFREHSLRETASFEKQIMSQDKYPTLFFLKHLSGPES